MRSLNAGSLAIRRFSVQMPPKGLTIRTVHSFMCAGSRSNTRPTPIHVKGTRNGTTAQR
jgi:hypothetical protein